MSRLRTPHPHELDDDQRALRERIVGGPRASGPQLFRLTTDDGGLTGPFGAMVVAPSVGEALSNLGEAIRYRSSLTPRVREIAILIVAARWRSQFEWYAHEAIARHVGLGEDVLAAIKEGRRPDRLERAELAAHDLCYAAAHDGGVDDERWVAALDELGEVAIVELVTLVGYYATLALMLNVFQIGVPDDGGLPFAEVACS